MKKAKIAGLVCLVVAVAGIAAYFFLRDKIYSDYTVEKEWDAGDALEYVQVDGALVRCGREGAQAVKPDGTILWNVTYPTMKNPSFVFCKSMMAVADVGGKQYLLSDGSGSTKLYTTPYPIQSISVSKQGVTAVLMNSGETDYIYLYSKEGELLSEIETVVARDGFPVAIALSEDGKKLVTSYMKVDGDEPVGSITFYNFGEVGRNEMRNLVAQAQYKDCMIPRVAFWDNDTVLVVGENVFEVFAMTEIPESVCKKEVLSEIKSIALGQYFCIITKNRDGQEVLEAYDKAGGLCMKKVITSPYVGMHTAGEEVVLYSYSGCDIFDVEDGLIYAGNFENGIRRMFAIGKNRYYLMEDRHVKVIKLK